MTNKIKVLFTEDEIGIRENISEILRIEGFEVVEANNGISGFELFLQNDPDIIISDIMMPECDGYQFLKKVRQSDSKNRNVPFIILSALGQKEDVINGINLEASDYLIKPIDFELLIAKVKQKAFSFHKDKEIEKNNINNIKNQVANIIPKEMIQYIDSISQISDVLKKEIYGPLPHQKYIDGLSRIYINSLRIKALIINFFNEDYVSSHIEISEDIVDPKYLLQKFIDGLNENFKSKIIINISDKTVRKIKVDRKITNQLFKNIIGHIFKINDSTRIDVSIYLDHLNCLLIIFSPRQKIDLNILKSNIENSIQSESYVNQGFDIDFVEKDSISSVIFKVSSDRVLSV